MEDISVEIGNDQNKLGRPDSREESTAECSCRAVKKARDRLAGYNGVV